MLKTVPVDKWFEIRCGEILLGHIAPSKGKFHVTCRGGIDGFSSTLKEEVAPYNSVDAALNAFSVKWQEWLDRAGLEMKGGG